ncbi:MAG: phage portal protein [Peptococcaceae bacterium]|jgi:SPP1 family phage portal protein|nr:phage portal protein [Peptococcaceae bacterium]
MTLLSILVDIPAKNLYLHRITKRLRREAYRAHPLLTIDGIAGDVEALKIEVSAENYQLLIDILKKAIIENANGFDAKDDRLMGNPNQMNILSMYSDIDLDANGMETEYQASFEELLYFARAHLKNTGGGDFAADAVEIVFNRNMMMSEAGVITNVKESVGVISTETLLSRHPWVDDVTAEIKRLEAERRAAVDEYDDANRGGGGGNGADKRE